MGEGWRGLGEPNPKDRASDWGAPHLQNVGKAAPGLSIPICTEGEPGLCHSFDPAPSSEASRLGVRFWDLLGGGGMRWETCGLLDHCCQSFPPSPRIFRIQVDLFFLLNYP